MARSHRCARQAGPVIASTPVIATHLVIDLVLVVPTHSSLGTRAVGLKPVIVSMVRVRVRSYLLREPPSPAVASSSPNPNPNHSSSATHSSLVVA